MAPKTARRAENGQRLSQPHSVQFVQGLLAEDALNVKEVAVLATSPLAVALELLREQPLRTFAVVLYGARDDLARDVEALLGAPPLDGARREAPFRIVCQAGEAALPEPHGPREVLPGVVSSFGNVQRGKWDNTTWNEPIEAELRAVFCFVPSFLGSRALPLGVCPLHCMHTWQNSERKYEGVPSKQPGFVVQHEKDTDKFKALPQLKARMLVRVVDSSAGPSLPPYGGACGYEDGRDADATDPEPSDDEHTSTLDQCAVPDVQPDGGVRKRVKLARTQAALDASAADKQRERDDWQRLRRRFGEWWDESGRLQPSDVRVAWDLYAEAIMRGGVDPRVTDDTSWRTLEPEDRLELLRDSGRFERWRASGLGGALAERTDAMIKAARDEDEQRRFRELFASNQAAQTREDADEHWRRVREKPWMLAVLGKSSTARCELSSSR